MTTLKTPVNLSLLFKLTDLKEIRLLINITYNYPLSTRKELTDYVNNVNNCNKEQINEMIIFCNNNNIFIRDTLNLIPKSKLSKRLKNLLLLDIYLPYYNNFEDINHIELVKQLIKMLKSLSISEYNIFNNHKYYYKLTNSEIRKYLLEYFSIPNEIFKDEDIKIMTDYIEKVNIKQLYLC